MITSEIQTICFPSFVLTAFCCTTSYTVIFVLWKMLMEPVNAPARWWPCAPEMYFWPAESRKNLGLFEMPSVCRCFGYWVVHYPGFGSNLDMLQGCCSKGKPIQRMLTKSVVGMTSSHTGLINNSNRAPQLTRDQIKSFKIPQTTMDADIPLVWSGLMAKLVYRKTIFRH